MGPIILELLHIQHHHESFHLLVCPLRNGPMRPIEPIFGLRGCCRPSSSNYWCCCCHPCRLSSSLCCPRCRRPCQGRSSQTCSHLCCSPCLHWLHRCPPPRDLHPHSPRWRPYPYCTPGYHGYPFLAPATVAAPVEEAAP